MYPTFWGRVLDGLWTTYELIGALASLAERLLHFAGRIVINVLLAISLFVLYYQAMIELGYPQPSLAPFFNSILRVFDTRVVWVIPLVFGATLGILHLWKLKLDQTRDREERHERWRQEYEAKQRMANKTPTVMRGPTWEPRPVKRPE